MKRVSVLLSSILILLTSTRCYHESGLNHCFINFANKSDKSIYIEQFEGYPDTISLIKDRFWPSEYNKVKPNGNSKYLCNSGYEAAFNEYQTIDTLMIFVFDAEKVEVKAEPQEAVIARYDVSLGDLQSNNWTLSYPPNDNMANIKMWPPFSSYHQ